MQEVPCTGQGALCEQRPAEQAEVLQCPAALWPRDSQICHPTVPAGQCKLNNPLFFLWVFCLGFFPVGLFPPHLFRTASCSNQPSQHDSQYNSGFFFFVSPKPDFPHSRKLPRWVLEILVMKYLGCVFEHCH